MGNLKLITRDTTIDAERTGRRDVAVIDTSIDDHQALINAAEAQGMEIILLSGTGNGVSELAAALEGRTGIDGLHVFSHGSQGQVHLGDTVLSSATLADHGEALEVLKGSLSEEGDLLLYGCNVAAGEVGTAFVEDLALMTGADIAASEDLTGHASLGGDWDLEVRSGDIDESSAFAGQALANFSELLLPGGTQQYVPGAFSVDGDNLSHSYFVISGNVAVEDGDVQGGWGGGPVPGVMKTYGGTEAYLDTNEVIYTGRGSPSIKVMADGTNLESFQLTAIKLDDYFDSHIQENLEIIGNKSDGSGTVSSGTVTGTSGDDVFTSASFGGWGSFSGVQLDYFTIQWTNGTSTAAADLTFLDFSVASMTAPVANTAPTVSNAPTDITVTEDAASNVDLSAASFADADGDSLTVTLSIDAGTFSTPADGSGVGAGVTETLVNSTTITLAGTAADINTYLDTATNIQYTGASNASGDNQATLTVTPNDGTTDGTAATVNIDISAVNDAPTAGGVPTDVTVSEDTASNFDLSAVTVADVDGDSLTVTLAASAGTFAATSSGGVTVGGSGTGSLTLAGTAANLNTFLDTVSNVQYTGASNASGDDAATFTINANDGTVNPQVGSGNIDITAVNDAPTATGVPSDVTVTEDTASNFDLSAVTVADVDGDSLTVTLAASAGTFAATSSGGVTVGGSGTGSLTLAGTAADINTFLDTLSNVQYTGASNASGDNAASFTINANDGTVNPQVGSANIDITAVNDAPTASGVPTDVTVSEDTASDFDLSAVTVADVDGDSLTVTLAASAGTFTAASGGGVTVGGSGTGSLTLAGTAANINTFLDTLSNVQYTGASNASGDDAATFTINAHDGTVNPQVGSGNIDITAVNDAPVFSGLDGAPSYTEGDPAVTLDANVTVSDLELSGASDYAGASLMIARNGGANAADSFSFDTTGALFTVSGGNLQAGGQTFATFTNSGGTLTVDFTSSGTTATQALVNDVQQRVQYQNTSDDPTGSAQLDWTFSDGNSGGQGTGGAATAMGSTTVTISGVNDAPTLTATGSDPTFTEGGAAAGLFSGASVSTVEAGQSVSALALTVTNVTDGASEILTFDGSDVALTDGNSVVGTATNGLTVNVSVSGGTATVSFSGASLTAAQVQTLVDGISYRNTSDNPTTGSNRVVTITQIVDDGGTAGGGVDTATPNLQSTVSLTAVNDAPVIGNLDGDNNAVQAGGSAVNIDAGGNATVSNVDSSDYNGGSLTIVDNGGDNTANGNFAVDGTNVTAGGDGTITAGETIAVGGVAVGTVDATNDGQGGNTLTIDFNSADATNARVQALLQNLTWSAAAGSGAQTFTATLNDGDGTGGGGDQDTTANFTMTVGNLPVIGNLDGDSVTFTEGDPVTPLDQGGDATLSDADAPANLDGGNLTATVSANAVAGEDILTLDTSGTVALSGTTAGSDVSVGGVVVGTLGNNVAAGNDLVVNLNTSATLARVQALLQAVAYDNDGEAPTASTRTIDLTVTDNDGLTSAASQVSVDVVSVNDAPTLTATGSDPTFTEDGGAASLFNGTAIDAVESADNISELTLTVANLADGSDELLSVDGEEIALADGTSGTTTANGFGYAVSLSGTTATVTLSKSDSAANWQTLVDGLAYRNASDAPTTASSRVVTLTSVQDDGGTANGGSDTTALAVTSTVGITAVNDAPTLTATAADPTFTEGGAAASLFSAASVGTVEAGQAVIGLTLTVTNVTNGANELLNLDGTGVVLIHGTNGVTADNGLNYSVSVVGTTATVGLSGGSLSPAAAQTLVDGLSYQNTSDMLDAGDRVVTLTSLQDDGGTANGGSDTTALAVASTVGITAINDAPTLTATAADPTFTEGGVAASLFSATSVSTVEAGQALKALTLTVSHVNDGGDELLVIDGTEVALNDGTSGTTGSGYGYTVSLAGSTATVGITGSLTAVETQTLVDGLAYRNASEAPTTAGNRTVTLTAVQDSGGTDNGGSDTTSLAIDATVTVVAVNDPPVVDLNGTAGGVDYAASFSAGGSAVAIADAGALLEDIDSAQLQALTVTLTNRPDGDGVEGLSLDATASAAASGAGLTVSYTAASGILAIVGAADLTTYQTILSGIQYENSVAPASIDTTDRTITVIANDGEVNSAAATAIVSVDAVPVVDLGGDGGSGELAGSYTEDDGAVLVAPSAAVIEPEGDALDRLVITLTNPQDGTDERIVLGGRSDGDTINGITIGYGGSGHAITLTGSAPAADYQALLRELQYANDSQAPDTTDRAITVQGRDVNGDEGRAVTLSLSVTGVNDAPTLTPGAMHSLAGTDEDTVIGSTLVSALLTGAGHTDMDTGAAAGIAITATTGNGAWQYSTDGTTWRMVGAVAESSALLLSDTTRIRYQPDGENGETATLNYRAWDQTSGSASTNGTRQTADTTTNGGTTAFSTTTAQADIAVSDVNDAPTVDQSISDQSFSGSGDWSFTLPGDVFVDVDTGDTLTLAATLDNDDPLPDWLDFDVASGAFRGNSPAGIGSLAIRVTATDQAGASVSDGFTLTLTETNDAPTGTDATLSLTAAGHHTFSAADFGFNDTDLGDGLQQVRLTTLPDRGTLTLDGVAMKAGDVISRAELDAGTLLFTKGIGSGVGYASFQFEVHDGTDYAAAASTLTLNVAAPLPDGVATEDGATVTRETTTTEDGRSVQVTEVAATGDDREEDPETPNGSLADITLAADDDDSPALRAGLPAGVGLRSEGTPNRQAREEALADLIARIEQKTPADSAPRAEMTGIGQSFLNALPEDAALFVRTVTPSVGEGVVLSDPITITGASTSGRQEALVIDVSQLPSGALLRLDDVDFAAIVGEARVIGGTGANVVTGDDSAQFIVLGEDDDVLYGGGGDDTIGSEGGDDLLFGGSGDDLLFGGAGADQLHGGLDVDVARYDGNHDDYVITQEHGVITVQAKDAADDIDTLINIERLVFADGEQGISYDDRLTWITGLYDQVLGRQADVGGVQYWAQRHAEGMSEADMAISFMTSEEAGQQLDVQGEGVDAVLDTLYQSLLGRDPDAEGKAFWAHELETGASLHSVVGGFMASEEMRTHDMTDSQWDFIA